MLITERYGNIAKNIGKDTRDRNEHTNTLIGCGCDVLRVVVRVRLHIHSSRRYDFVVAVLGFRIYVAWYGRFVSGINSMGRTQETLKEIKK